MSPRASGSGPSGTFQHEIYCGCGGALDLYTRWNGLTNFYEYADPDTGLKTDECPQCGQSAAGVLADHRSREDSGAS